MVQVRLHDPLSATTSTARRRKLDAAVGSRFDPKFFFDLQKIGIYVFASVVHSARPCVAATQESVVAETLHTFLNAFLQSTP
jgi:hypothetical protein